MGAFAAGGVAVVAGLLAGLGRGDLVVPVLVAACLAAVTVPALRRQGVRENDRRVTRMLTLALAVHLAAAGVALYVALVVYGGRLDATYYHRVGTALSQAYRAGHVAGQLPNGITGTRFPGFLMGLLYTVTGPQILSGFVVSAWLGFLGLFFTYRGVVLGLPDVELGRLRPLLFFLPSLCLWPSFIGKDAVMAFGLGLAIDGTARAICYGLRRGAIPLLAGMGAMLLVRPFVAAFLAVGLLGAMLVKRADPRLRSLAPLARAGGVIVTVALVLFVIASAQRFLEHSGLPLHEGLTATLGAASGAGDYGGSRFTPVPASSPSRFPAAAFTVLFRPTIVEVGSVTSLFTAVEGTFLLLLSLARWRSALAAIAGSFRRPLALCLELYLVLAVLAFSAFANFGLLARERVQILPAFLTLLCLPPLARRSRPRPVPGVFVPALRAPDRVAGGVG